MDTMKALVYQKPGRANGSVTHIPRPACGENQVMIKVMTCCICKPAESSHDRTGSVLGEYPAVPGHEFSGVVEQVGPGVTGFKPGDRVTADNGVPCGKCHFCQKGQPAFCLHFGSMGHNLQGGMAQYLVADESAVFRIPHGVSLNAAALTELVGCCMNGIDNADIRYGHTVLILGAGASGMLLAQLAKDGRAGAVVCTDRVPGRLEKIAQKGVQTQLVGRDDYGGFIRAMREKYPLGVERIIDACGDAALVQQSLELLSPGGVFVGYSFPSGAQKAVPVDMSLFARKQLTYKGSTFGTHRFQQCLDAMATGKVDCEMIITHEYPLDDYFEALDTNLNDPGAIKIAIHPNTVQNP